MPDPLTIDDFKTLEGETVQLRNGQQSVVATVASTRAGKSSYPDHRQPFSVMLQIDQTEPYWPQGTYILVHPTLGELELFIVPLGPKGDSLRYEVSFS